MAMVAVFFSSSSNADSVSYHEKKKVEWGGVGLAMVAGKIARSVRMWSQD